MKKILFLVVAMAALSACALPAIGSGYEADQGDAERVASVEPVPAAQGSVIYMMKIDGID